MTQRTEIGGELGYGEYSAREHFPVLLKRLAKTKLRTQDELKPPTAGDMTQRTEFGVTWTQDFNAENRLASITNAGTQETWTFVYNDNGNRVRQQNPDGSITIFLGGGLYTVEDAAGNPQATKYYAIAGQRVALDGANGLQFLLTDHLGSIVAVADTNGDLVDNSEQRYMPFGSERLVPDITETDFGFTGQRSLEATGLMDYNARFYDPVLGRFLQPDPVISSFANPMTLNRFSYVNNNPINYNDPFGYEAKKCKDEGCKNPEYILRRRILNKYGITLSDELKSWKLKNMIVILRSLGNIDKVLGGNVKRLVNGSTFKLDEYIPPSDDPSTTKDESATTYSGFTSGKTITFYTMGNQAIRQMNVYHEFGHLLDNAQSDAFSGALSSENDPSFINSGTSRIDPAAFTAGRVDDPNYPLNSDGTGGVQALQHDSTDVNEQWADIFANYVAGNINPNSPQGRGMLKFITRELSVALTPFIN
jgi:RHS repeat-associated protein